MSCCGISPIDALPSRLSANEGLSFKGSYVFGLGFTFDDSKAAGSEASTIADMTHLVEQNPANAERIFPYVGGTDLNSHPQHLSSRYVIDLGDMTEDVARSTYSDLLQTLEERVKPQRSADKRESYRKYWWRFAERQPSMLAAIRPLARVLAIARVTHFVAFTFLPKGTVYNEKVIVFAYEQYAPFSVLQSRVHELWTRTFTSTLKDDLNYSPSDCFRTFPFPSGYLTDAALAAVGQTYHDHRAELMVAADQGMTKTYNRFHKESETSPAIQRLRELHDEMDRAVLAAYGWEDLADTLKPEFLTEDTEDDHTYKGRYFWPAAQRDLVLSRLLALNAERYAEEVRQGLHEKGRKRVRSEEDDGE